MVTEEEWVGELEKANKMRIVLPAAGLLAMGLLVIPAIAAGDAVSNGILHFVTTIGVLLFLLIPEVVLLVGLSDRQARVGNEKLKELTAELTDAIEAGDRQAVIRDAQAQRQRFESRLANALDMAEGEPEVIDVIERSFAAVLPDAPVELLLADNSHAHLLRMAGVGPGRRAAVLQRRLTRSLPGSPPGPDAGLLRQRRPRRLPKAAQPPAGPPLRHVCAGVDHGAHGRRDPCHRQGGG